MNPALAGLILAAGRGTRFGGPAGAKLLAPFHGRPLAARVLETAGAALSEGILLGAVCVHRADAGGAEIAGLARAAGLTAVANPDPGGSLGSSLRTGLALMAEACGAVMVLPADQPLLRVEVLRHVADAWRSDPKAAVAAGYRDMPGIPGHPVVIPRAAWGLLGHQDEGFRAALRHAGIPLVTIPVNGACPDVDTTADLAALERMSWS